MVVNGKSVNIYTDIYEHLAVTISFEIADLNSFMPMFCFTSYGSIKDKTHRLAIIW